VTFKDGAPVVAARHDPEIVDEEPNDGFQRDPTGRQVQLVERQGVTGSVRMQVGSGRVVF
jgi:hypothetical protein